MMKRLFETPQIDLVRIDAKDVIVTSGTAVHPGEQTTTGETETGYHP